MKLLAKTNRSFLLSSLVVFLVGGMIFYTITQAIIREEVSEVLEFELQQKIEEMERLERLPEAVTEVEFEMRKLTVLPEGNQSGAKKFQDTLLWDAGESEYIPYRQLTIDRNLRGQPYRLTLRESLIESEEILFAVSLSLITLFALMTLTLWLVNYFQARRLWAGFYENIKHLRNYDVATGAAVPKVDSDVDEFQELNAAIIKMTDKIRSDYRHLKEFSENASHEMQTPLAIIQSNLDLLTQSDLQEDQHTLISRISQATRRMSGTHRALLLLSKIENQQFRMRSPVDFSAIITERLNEFADFLEAKEIRVEFAKTAEDLVVAMNPQLSDILVDNLLTNAIKHNVPQGSIEIRITPNTLTMRNSGVPLRSDPAQLFQRFSKDNPTTDSAGLGMAIMKVICDNYGIIITYDYLETYHTLHLRFPDRTTS